MSTYSDADGDTVRLDSIERAIADIRDGKAVVVVDDPGRENEGDIIFAASKATPELMGFLIRHSSGYVCAPAPGHRPTAPPPPHLLRCQSLSHQRSPCDGSRIVQSHS